MTLTIGGHKGGPWWARFDAYWNNDGTVCVRTSGHWSVTLTWRELEQAIKDVRQGRTGVVYDATREMGMLGDREHVTISINRKEMIKVVQHDSRLKRKPARLHVSEWEKILKKIEDGHEEWNRAAGISPVIGPVYLPDRP